MKVAKINTLLKSSKINTNYSVQGWVKTFRANRFIALNDGSSIKNLQCVVDFKNIEESILKRINSGAALHLEGFLVKSQGSGQEVELQVKKIKIHGDSDPDEFPIQPKKHSFEFLREKAHLRIRTTTFAAVMRVRSALSFAVHKFFQEKGFYYINTPIITGSDAEGAGELFRVSTIDPKNPPLDERGFVDYKKDFFGKETNLTVSGQLEAESYALGLGEVYTFGPTFRAENSNTTRHLAEFWMIEPEMAFYDLHDNMNLAEKFITGILKEVHNNCFEDLTYLDERLAKEDQLKPLADRSPMGLLEKIKFVINNEFKRVSYTEAYEILRNSKPNKKKKFKFPIDQWGVDLQSEHERYLVEKHFRCPVILFDYPAEIKAFYMRRNEDGKTVRAMDILFPGIGEIVGGSQREERLEIIEKCIKELKLDAEELSWYLDLRRFGSVPHSGFGMGFERLVQFATGMSNIRDVIPFPRTPQNATF
ncbi:MAG: asparagine--tRNA ligase [Flavobacteriaceae bacterium TMED179]|nr:MAG: asparagine--tRNA ligase [Flavobacteriaceae bacterium TMED179]